MFKSNRLVTGLKAILWVGAFTAGVIAVRYAGEIVFYLPGMIAKDLSLTLTGSTRGVATSIFFYLIAAGFVLALATVGWAVIRLDKWLDRRRHDVEEGKRGNG